MYLEENPIKKSEFSSYLYSYYHVSFYLNLEPLGGRESLSEES
jgi:hypothetical protein